MGFKKDPFFIGMILFKLSLIIFLDTMDDRTFIQFLKTNCIRLSKEAESKLCSYIEGTLSYKRASTHYQLAKTFLLINFGKSSMRFIERCFVTVAETNNFLELGYDSVAKILSSSELDITSELQVFNAAKQWLCHDSLERNKYAKDLLLKVRLPLLSGNELDHILGNTSSFKSNKECLQLIEDILENKNHVKWKDFKFCRTSRHCNQNMYNILVFDYVKEELFSLIRLDDDKKELNRLEELPAQPAPQHEFKSVYLKGAVYTFGGFSGRDALTYQKYSLESGRWEYSREHELSAEIEGFCACALMNSVHVIGGETGWLVNNDCFELDTKEERLRRSETGMNLGRTAAACAAFQGRVLVCGGETNRRLSEVTRTAEVLEDGEWSYIQDMTVARSGHCLVAGKNKLFVIGGVGCVGCEVYDGRCFVAMKSPPELFQFRFDYTEGAVLIGGRIVVFGRFPPLVAFYDTARDQWSEEKYLSEGRYDFEYCIKLPRIQ